MSQPLHYIPRSMSALAVREPGRPPRLAMVSKPVPDPAPGEALLRVDACGFCHHDLLVMSGVLRRGVAEGVTLGHEIAGTIVRVAPDLSDELIGTRAVSLLTAACGRCDRCRSGHEHRCAVGQGIGHGRDGGFAEYVTVPAFALAPVPDHVSAHEAALLACPAGVALNAVQSAGITDGDTVVVTGAGGGLGVHALQIAVHRGAQAIAVTTSPGKVDQLEALGALAVIDASDLPDFSGFVNALTDDAGVAAVIDTVGPPLWPETLRCLGQFGRLVLLGDVSGQPVNLRMAEVIFRDARILGVSGVSLDMLRETVRLTADGHLRPVVAQTLPLTAEGVAEAWRLVSERGPLGRVVLTPPPPDDPA